MPGGLGEAQPANDDIQQLVNQVKSQLAAHAPGNESKDLKAISFKSQVVAGTNYFIKVHAGDQHLHLKVHKPLPHTRNPAEIMSVQSGKTHRDEILFF